MATSNRTTEVKLETLTLDDSPSALSTSTSTESKPEKKKKVQNEAEAKIKKEKQQPQNKPPVDGDASAIAAVPKVKKQQQQTAGKKQPGAAAAVSAESSQPPAEELTFNQTLEQIEAALQQWLRPPTQSKGRGLDEKILPKPGERNIFITSALPYVNNVPHLGNLVGSLLSADVYARYCRLRGYNTLYLCGTDEYGTTTEAKALEERCTPQQICDKYYKLHCDIYKWFNIEFDLFGRTSTQKQTEICQDIFWRLHERGYILANTLEQLFCVNCQRFLADRFVEGTCPDVKCKYVGARGDQCDRCGKLINAIELVEPKCQICKSTPEIKQSDHLFLDLPKLSDKVRTWYEKAQSTGNWTHTASAITEAWLDKGLEPRCISRDLSWGTPVPLDGYQDKVFYVWFDAPIGYISITANYTERWREWWHQPELVHYIQFMAKDNVPFHSVIFPACLLGSEDNYTLVNSISGIDYLNYEDAKFSKSRGVGVFGNDAQQTEIPADIWRFYLMFVRPESTDSIFSWDDLLLKNNTELLNNLGNFVNRALAFCESKLACQVATLGEVHDSSDRLLVAQITYELSVYKEAMEKTRLRDGLKSVLRMSGYGNRYLQSKQPWVKLKGSDADRADAETCVALSLNLVYLLSLVLQPFMPSTSDEIRHQLNMSSPLYSLDDEFRIYLPAGHKINLSRPLFQKILKPTVDALRERFSGKQVQQQNQAATPVLL